MQKRLVISFCTFLLLFSTLFIRLGALTTDEELKETGNKFTSYTLTFNKTRAQIYDCKMNSLVNQNKSYIASCLPAINNIEQIKQNFNLNIPSDIDKKINDKKPFLLKSNSSDVGIQNVTMLTVSKRYSNNQLAPHILGYLDAENENGVTGIEKSFNDYLKQASSKSTITYRLDGTMQPFLGYAPELKYAPIINSGVVLTIDSRLQEICQEVGGRLLKKGAIVVMEPQTGKIRACASFPTYNPNDIASAVKDEENSPLLNRAFSQYNVGSTFKVVTTATALSQGILPTLSHKCTGSIDIKGQVFRCHNKNGHGVLDMKNALANSCNPYFISLSQQLDKTRFLNMAKDLSFSKVSDFASTLSTKKGYVPTLDEIYNPADVANFAFGQGLLMATPIQLAQMMSSVVNGGNTPTATLIEGFSDNGKLIDKKQDIVPPIKAMTQDVANTIKDYLVYTTMNTSNQKAKPTNVTAGGKTATAQTGQYIGEEEMLLGWFVGFFPADKPKYVVTVLCEDAKSGNNDASPVFKEIADKLYEPLVLPDELKTKK